MAQSRATGRRWWTGRKRVGKDPVQEWEVEIDDWPAVLDNVRTWIAEITRYEETSDLWALPRQELRASLEQASDNALFTRQEPAEVAAGLDQVIMSQLSTLAARFELTAAQVDNLSHAVGELKEASTRLGKKDWTLVLIAWLTMAVPPNAAMHLVGAVLHGIGQIVGVLVPLSLAPT